MPWVGGKARGTVASPGSSVSPATPPPPPTPMTHDPFRPLLRPHLLALEPYASARSEFAGRAEVYLDANENPYETGRNRYPDPLQRALKAKLAELHGVPAEHLFVGNGSDEAIDLLMRLVGRPGVDRVTQLPPTYGMYAVSAAINDLAVRSVPLDDDFQPDVDAVLAPPRELAEADPAVDKLLFVCTPNNPTGNDVDPARVRALLDAWPGLVVVDQAYAQFSRQRPYTDWLGEYPRLVVLQTLSKAYGLAGARLGIAFAHPALVGYLNAVKPPYNVSSLAQEAALAALADQATVDEQVATLLAERARLSAALAAVPQVEEVYPSDANFVLTRFRDAARHYRALVERGVIVRNQSSKFGGVGHLRFTVGRPEENERLLAELARL